MSNLVITDLAVSQDLSAKALAEIAGGCYRPRRFCIKIRGRKFCFPYKWYLRRKYGKHFPV